MSQSDKDVLERMRQGTFTIKAMSDAVGVTPLDRMVALAKRIVTRSPRTSIRNIRSKIGDQLNIQSPPPLVSKVNQHRRVRRCTLIKEKLKQDPEFLSRITHTSVNTLNSNYNPQKQQGGINQRDVFWCYVKRWIWTLCPA
ncbi:hypothetical protein MP228_012301 [Amoeboaphelidium protococcarum]|nr:hypothetical protein MP228_012301 [Amoeboaphelidium protococcarum]